MKGSVADADRLHHALRILHYLSPIAVLAYFMLAGIVSFCTLQSLKASGVGPRKAILWLMSLVLLSYVVEACMLLTDTLANHARHSTTGTNVSWLPTSAGCE